MTIGKFAITGKFFVTQHTIYYNKFSYVMPTLLWTWSDFARYRNLSAEYFWWCPNSEQYAQGVTQAISKIALSLSKDRGIIQTVDAELARSRFSNSARSGESSTHAKIRDYQVVIPLRSMSVSLPPLPLLVNVIFCTVSISCSPTDLMASSVLEQSDTYDYAVEAAEIYKPLTIIVTVAMNVLFFSCPTKGSRLLQLGFPE